MSRTGGWGEVYRIYKVNNINFVHFFFKQPFGAIPDGKKARKAQQEPAGYRLRVLWRYSLGLMFWLRRNNWEK